MSVTVISPISAGYVPNGATTAFAFNFKIGSTAEVKVFRVLAGVTTIISPSDYTVTLAGDGEGGTVTFHVAPLTGTGTIYIESDPLFTQTMTLGAEGPFTPTVLNDAFDRAAIRDLRLKQDTADVAANLATEIQNRINAVTAEANTRAGADNTLQANIDSETAARQSAVTAEANARIAADNAEVTARNTAIGVETTNRQTAVSAEATTRAAADALEASVRAAGDNGLLSAINNEIGNRTNATNSLLALLAGISLSAATLTAFDRSALAALDHNLGLPAILMTDGGTFTPVVGVDLSAKVTVDPNKGIYVPFASDVVTPGLNGAWVRATDRVTLGHFQCAGDNISDDGTKLNQALVTCNALGIPMLYGNGRSYYASVTTSLKSNVTLKDAVVRSDATVVMSTAGGVTGHGLDGVKLIQSAGLDSRYNIDFSCAGIKIRDLECVASPATHAVVGYFRNASSKADVLGFKTSGANGVFVQGKGHQFDDYDLNNGGGQDDGWVMKAPGVVGTPAQTEDINFGKGFVRSFGAAVAFGSEVGRQGADDPTRENYIRGVHIDGLIAENCTSLCYSKGGAIYDYRDGDTEDIHFENFELRDMAGVAARRLAYFQWARGNRARYFHFTNGTACYRCPNRSGGTNAGITFLTFDYPGGSIPAEVDGVYFDGLTIRDPFGGIANGALTTVGYNGIAAGSVVPAYPIDHFLNTDATTGAGGTLGVLKRVEIKGLVGQGCARAAIALVNAAMIVGPIRLHQPDLEDFAAGTLGSSDMAGIMSRATIEIIGPMRSIPSALAPAGTRAVMGDSQPDKTVNFIGGVIRVPIGEVVAGTPKYVTHWFDRDTWIAGVDLVAGDGGVVQHDANYATIVARNMTGAGTDLKTITTKTTPSGGTALPQDTLVSMNGTTKFTGAGAYVAKGSALRLAVTHSGSGAAIPQLNAQLRIIGHGAP